MADPPERGWHTIAARERYIVFLAYDKTDNGRSKLVIRKMEWDEGWPVVSLDFQ